MGEFGELFGGLTIFFFIATVMNYIVKFINRRFGREIAKYPEFKKVWMKLMKLLVKYHKYFGFATVASLMIHFLVQSNFKYISTTGLIAGGVMLSQLLLGMYGAFINKKRKGTWFITHRTISVALILAIAIHLATN